MDTGVGFLNVSRGRAFFRASADPVGSNPYGNCQWFSTNTRGGGLRQLTHFNSGRPAIQPACAGTPECGLATGWGVQDNVTSAVVFESSCDPFHTNAFGEQVFAMRPDGSGLRQLTDAAGFTENPDTSIEVQLPGPFAYSARPD